MGEEFHCVLELKFQAFLVGGKKVPLSTAAKQWKQSPASSRPGPRSPPQSVIITGYLSSFTHGGREAQRAAVTSTGDTAAKR